MAGSRHLQGTIVQRVATLLASGSLKEAPVWYDVVCRFPPPKHALLSLVPRQSTELPKKIYLEDDQVTRKFYGLFDRAKRDPESLFDHIKSTKSKTKIFLEDYEKNKANGLSENDAFEKSCENFKIYLLNLREEKEINIPEKSLAENELHEKSIDLDSDDIYKIFIKKP